MKYIKALIESHKFFVKESPAFMQGTPMLEYLRYYPVAYLKFMYYTINDLRRYYNHENN